MVKIRLRRVGAKKQPSFRVVVADSRSPRDGRFIEQIGFYNPRTEPETLRIDEERALYWLNVGAQPSDSVARLLRTTGTMERFGRLKQGEPLEDLLVEAEEALAAKEQRQIEEELEAAEEELEVEEELAEAEMEPATESVEEAEEAAPEGAVAEEPVEEEAGPEEAEAEGAGPEEAEPEGAETEQSEPEAEESEEEK